MFFRLTTDRRRIPVALGDLYGGGERSTCWIIGAGPSLAAVDLAAIARSSAPTMAINLAGSRGLRPTFWTSYDATARFHRSTYQDAGTLKLLHARRAMDLIPGTTWKVCDAPATVFFDLEPGRDYTDWLAPHRPLVDWADSMVQAIALAVHLGFRRLLLAGCEMRVRPSDAMRLLARRRGIEWDDHSSLARFVRACEDAGLSRDQLDRCPRPQAYHFDEDKPLAAAIATDEHYFRVAQSLRLCRRSLADRGVELVSATPGSRLNDWFPTTGVAELLADLPRRYGDAGSERERDRYTLTEPRVPAGLGLMRDVPPYVRPRPAAPASAAAAAPLGQSLPILQEPLVKTAAGDAR